MAKTNSLHLLVNHSGIITLQSGGTVNSRIAVIGHKKTYNGVQAIAQATIPVVYA